MNNRQQIIDELGAMRKVNEDGYSHNLSYTMKKWELELVADFIIQDRKRTIQEYKTIFFCDCDKDI